jgi:pyruvate dehydrogenase E1 component beta subunit
MLKGGNTMNYEMKEMTYKDAVNLAMREEMRRDEEVFLMGEDVGLYGGAFGVSVGMLEEFGEDRVRDTPISEAVIAGAGAGAAVTGMRPIVEIMFMDFTTIAMDSLVNQAAKMRYMFGGKAKVPMTLRCPGGSGTGAAAQHSQSLEAWFCHVPGLKVVVPGTAADAKGLLKAAIRDDNPVVFVEQKTLYKEKGMVPVDEDFIIPLGKGEIKKEGTDVTVVSYGRMLPRVLKVAEELEKEGISVEVVDPRTLVPLDKEIIINSVIKTGRVVLVNEACKTGGYIGEIASVIAESEAFDYLDAPILRLAGLDVPIPYNPELEKAAVPSEEQIRAGILKVMNR